MQVPKSLKVRSKAIEYAKSKYKDTTKNNSI